MSILLQPHILSYTICIMLYTMTRPLHILILILIPLLLPSFATAATLYLDPQEHEYGLGDTFFLSVRVDNEDTCVNAAEVSLRYPTELLKAIDVSRGKSIFTLWPEAPVVDKEQGVITFMGGIPAGYCGRTEGDPGLSNILAQIVFTIPAEIKTQTSARAAEVRFDAHSRVLLNDGLGTEAETTLRAAKLTIHPDIRTPKNEWLEILRSDEVSPERFSIGLEQNRNLFGGEYFIVFSTTDKQSGLDFYEVRESDQERTQFKVDSPYKARWIPAESPYPLEDQNLRSLIRVRAVDKAGNERIEELVPDISLARGSWVGSLTSMTPVMIASVFVVFLGLVVGGILWIQRRTTRSLGLNRSDTESVSSVDEHNDDEPMYLLDADVSVLSKAQDAQHDDELPVDDTEAQITDTIQKK